MKLNKTGMAFVFIVACGLSAIYGAATVKLQLFPYPHIVEIKDRIFSGATSSRPLYYLDRKDFFESHGKPANIVMVGDSITNRAEWSELLNVAGIANRGINSDTTDGVLERMSSIYSTHAKKAFVMIGINDIAKGLSPDLIFENYKSIIEGLLSNNITPYIQSTLLAGRSEHQYNSSVNALNSMLIVYAGERGIIFIDLNATLSEEGVLRDSYTTDGVHLSGAGYAAWGKAIGKHIRSVDSSR